MKKLDIAVLLSFTAGFVDTASFLGLEGLFTAHVTGNFVTLGATLVYGTHGVLAKLLALPEFVLVVALTRLAGAALAAHRMPALRLLLAGEVAFLLAFFMLAAALGPFPNSDTPAALLTGFSGVAAAQAFDAQPALLQPTGSRRPRGRIREAPTAWQAHHGFRRPAWRPM